MVKFVKKFEYTTPTPVSWYTTIQGTNKKVGYIEKLLYQEHIPITFVITRFNGKYKSTYYKFLLIY